MAVPHGIEGFFSYDAVELQNFITNISNPQPVDEAETTAISNSTDFNKDFIPGALSSEFSIEFVWDPVIVAALFTRKDARTSAAVIYGPEGDTTGDRRTTAASAFITNITQTTDVAGAVTGSASFRVSGAVVNDVFP